MRADGDAMNVEQIQESQKLQNANEEDRSRRIDDGRIVDRIRDILVGSQMREYEGRLERLDERLVKEATEARTEVEQRLTDLERFSKAEIESLTHRLNAEQSERRIEIEKLCYALTETAKAFESKIKNLDEYAREIYELHRQLLEQWRALSGEFKEKHDQMQAGLNRETEQIRGSMIGRETLAQILNEISGRLKDHSRAPNP
jgi:hypothetical protein